MRIVHVFRDPVGGVFRHVRDLVSEQDKAGHSVGIICDSNTGGAYEAKLFEQLKPQLKLGLHRIPMQRSIVPQDIIALCRTSMILSKLKPDVTHAHSAKGGVYGRIGSWFAGTKASPIKSFYCPHGGAMHYEKGSLKGRIFFAAERFLERFTTSLIFVSGYEQSAYHDKVGSPTCPEQIVYNGLGENEFEPVQPNPDAADFLYIGMKRDLKGPDVFLDALFQVRQQSVKKLTAWFVGDGPDVEKYHQQINTLGLADCVTESPAMPAREAFKLAKIVVVPSRAESMPYLVLEAMAAQKPIICTNVGGIPEIFATRKEELVPPGDAEALAQAMAAKFNNPDNTSEAVKAAAELKSRFSLKTMAAGMEKTYGKQDR